MDGNTENKVNKSIEEYADELIAQYEKELAADQGEGHYSLDSSYKVVTDNDKYLCLRIDTTEIMASGAQFVKIFTVDKATGNVISLKDLFANRPDALDKISEISKSKCAARWLRTRTNSISWTAICLRRISRVSPAARVSILMNPASW